MELASLDMAVVGSGKGARVRPQSAVAIVRQVGILLVELDIKMMLRFAAEVRIDLGRKLEVHRPQRSLPRTVIVHK